MSKNIINEVITKKEIEALRKNKLYKNNCLLEEIKSFNKHNFKTNEEVKEHFLKYYHDLMDDIVIDLQADYNNELMIYIKYFLNIEDKEKLKELVEEVEMSNYTVRNVAINDKIDILLSKDYLDKFDDCLNEEINNLNKYYK